MAFNPFNSADGSSLEQGNPLTSSVKKAANAVSSQTVQQAQATKQSFVDQLYGNTTPTTEETDQTGESGAQQPTQAQKTPLAQAMQGGNSKTPAEQTQIDEARKKLHVLQEMHNKKYFGETFGEEAQAKRRQREEQEEQMKLQDEQEERERIAQEKENQNNTMQSISPPGKGRGRNRMSAPIAVTQAKTKTEINRGASG
jgi:hypothetical protein